MSKKLLISVFLIFFVFSLMLFSQEESKEKKIWEDERISITVDKVERFDSFPDKYKTPNATYRPPDKGCDFVFIHISIDEKKDLNMNQMDLRLGRPNSPYVIDGQGGAHWASIAQYSGGGSKLFGGGGYLFFHMRKESTPVQLEFVYPYREEPPKPKKTQYGCVSIKLYKIKVKVEEAIIRLRSQTDSETVGNASLGTVFDPERKVGEWYEVSFRDESGFIITGFIHESEVDMFVEIERTPEIK